MIASPSPDNIDRAAHLLRSGQLVSFPTETVYGLGADARNGDAIRRIFAAKGRPAEHPLVHLAGPRRCDVGRARFRRCDGACRHSGRVR